MTPTPLTDEEIVAINDKHYNLAFRNFEADNAIARAVEAAVLAKQAQGEPVAGLERCNFDDECDFCSDPQGGTWAKISHNAEDCTETDFYICGCCIHKAIKRMKAAPVQAQDDTALLRQCLDVLVDSRSLEPVDIDWVKGKRAATINALKARLGG